MNNIENHIDDLYKNKLGSATAEHSNKHWKVLLKKYRIIKFYKFSLVSFNIYYVASGVAISAILWFYLNYEKSPIQNTTPKPSNRQLIISKTGEQKGKSEFPSTNNEQKKLKQNVIRENLKLTVLKKQNYMSDDNILTDTIVKQSQNYQTSSTPSVPEHTQNLPLTQTSNNLSKEQQIRKNNKIDSVIKYDTTVISKKKVKLKWNKSK